MNPDSQTLCSRLQAGKYRGCGFNRTRHAPRAGPCATQSPVALDIDRLLARLSGLFARTADLGGYRSRGGDHHLMARLARWGPDTASRRYLFADAGGLIAFGSDFAERFRATFTSLIPKGGKTTRGLHGVTVSPHRQAA
jgi:hypothetical protein